MGRTRLSSILTLNQNGPVQSNTEDKVKVFNKYFCSISQIDNTVDNDVDLNEVFIHT